MGLRRQRGRAGWSSNSANNLSNYSLSGEVNKTRAQSIAALEDAPGKSQVIRMIQERGHVYCRQHYYNFWSFVWRLVKEPTQFRNFAAFQVAAEAVSWVEFAESFIQAALECASPAKLQETEPNHEGLRHFMSGRRPPPGSTILRTYHS